MKTKLTLAGLLLSCLFLVGGSNYTPPTGGNGTGDVVGPASSTDNAIARFDGTGGKTLLNSTAIILDDGNMGVGGTPDSRLTVIGDSPGNVGGFFAGALEIRSPSALVNANSVMTGHNSFGGNKQLWYLGSVSSSTDDIALINRQNGYIAFSPNNSELMRLLAAGRVGIGTSVPATSALLELSSTVGALLMSRMTTTQRDALIPVDGMQLYNSTDNRVQVRENAEWVNVSTASFGEVFMIGNATLTTITTANVAVLVAGTTTAGATSGFTASAAGRLTYTGATTKKFLVSASIGCSGAANVQIVFEIAKNGTEIVNTGSVVETSGPSEISNSTAIGIIELATSDFVEVFVTNTESTADIRIRNLHLIVREM